MHGLWGCSCISTLESVVSVLRVSRLTSSWDGSQICIYIHIHDLAIIIECSSFPLYYTSVGDTNKLIGVGTTV